MPCAPARRAAWCSAPGTRRSSISAAGWASTATTRAASPRRSIPPTRWCGPTAPRSACAARYFRGLHSTIAFWWLDIDSELLFVGDAGSTEASRPSRRYGVEIANYYSPTEWLTFDADASLSHARFRDSDPAGDHIPGSIESVVAAGVTVHGVRGFTGELRVRYFGPRALTEDDSVRADDVILLSTRLAYQITENFSVDVEIFNLLNRKDSDIEYYYPSRLPGEPAGPDEGGTNDVHFHPVSGVSVRAGLTARF